MAKRPSLVEQVRDELLKQLRNGTYAVGDRLPNEQEMSERYDVSRATIREAYRALSDAGYLDRRHGTGTFVQRTAKQQSLDSILSYVSMIREAGYAPGVRVVSSEIREADEDECETLRLPARTQVLAVERLHTADDHIVLYSVDRIPMTLITKTGSPDLEGSLFELLENVGHGPRTGRARLAPVAADPRIAELLEVESGSPLLYIDEVDYGARGETVMLSEEWHVGDVIALWLNRRATERVDG